MHRTTRALIVLAALGSAGYSAVGTVATPGHAEALVGPSQTRELRKTGELSSDQVKAAYRRPASIPFPAHNPYTAEKAALGKKLFFDSRLSGGNLLSCASCHNPAFGWGDGQPKGIGHSMKELGRRSPSIVNAAFGDIFMWDGRAASLEEQALGPIKTDVEMNLPLDRLLERLKHISEYEPLFQSAFPKEGISETAVAKAIATYERTVVSGRAPFDAWADGDDKAISEQAHRGFVIFNTRGGCSFCHRGWNFTDDGFYDTGLPDPDIGRAKQMPGVEKMQHAFKAPSLREVTRRTPYMHDGSLANLDAVIEHYNRGGIARPSRSDLIRPLGLSTQEKADLVAFMRTLTSDLDPTTVPVLPR